MSDEKPSLLQRVIRVPAEIVVAIFILLDSIVTPLFRPIVRWLSKLQVVRRLERAIDSLPAYVILALLVVPFGFAELAKVYGLILVGEGHYRTGMTMFIGAYVVSILVCERTFHAGKNKLMTIGWFKRLYDWLMMIRDHVFGWLKATRAWRLGVEVKEKVRLACRTLGDRFRSLFGMKPKRALERH